MLLLAAAGCARTAESPPPAAPPARNIVLITIDTLRADGVGAYGHAGARTPALDALASRGTRFDQAFATAPITLTSHASLMTGRYPPGHGARHNGMPVSATVPLLAENLAKAGLETGAFVGAFPLDRRFGLARGFATYGDRMPRVAGRLASERPGQLVVDEAIAWIAQMRAQRFFLWVHLFEPHAPYGRPGAAGPVRSRYDDEVAEADRQVARLIDALGSVQSDTLVVATADHGEAFGEHGEIAHSLFVYDTTLRVPLVIAGPGVKVGVVDVPVSLVDVAPTIARLAGIAGLDTDGIDLGPALAGGSIPSRSLYAESFAPQLDFGWSPLRTLREEGWKAIDAPRPELYRVATDPQELREVAASEPGRLATLRRRLQQFGPGTLAPPAAADPESAARLQSLGYVGSGSRTRPTGADPKDRRELAADLARITGGELDGAGLEAALRRVLSIDAGNPQAHLRLGFVLQGSKRCPEAIRHFTAAIEGGMPGADPHLGIAGCHAEARRYGAAADALRRADLVEPDNPVVLANLGIVLSDGGSPQQAIAPLQRALAIDPDFHEARFNLAVAHARLGQRADGAREAATLLQKLPADAPQRSEVQRLLDAVR